MVDARKFAGDDTGSDGLIEGGKDGVNMGSLPEVSKKRWGMEKLHFAVEGILAVRSGQLYKGW